jgi:hypothetical protein
VVTVAALVAMAVAALVVTAAAPVALVVMALVVMALVVTAVALVAAGVSSRWLATIPVAVPFDDGSDHEPAAGCKPLVDCPRPTCSSAAAR